MKQQTRNTLVSAIVLALFSTCVQAGAGRIESAALPSRHEPVTAVHAEVHAATMQQVRLNLIASMNARKLELAARLKADVAAKVKQEMLEIASQF